MDIPDSTRQGILINQMLGFNSLALILTGVWYEARAKKRDFTCHKE
jgi:hypothetical protein